MANNYRYIVHVVCTGTISETWRVTSPTPIEADDMHEALHGDDDNGITSEFLTEETSDEEGREIVRIEADEETAVRHTTCQHCGQDIEGIEPFAPGTWRDRGNNTHCPTEAGDKGQQHAPVKES